MAGGRGSELQRMRRGSSPYTAAAALFVTYAALLSYSVADAAAAGVSHSCAVLTGGFVKCWGDASRGQLGQINKTRGNETTDLLGDTLPYVNLGANFEAVSVEAGLYFNCAMSVDKAVKCWGMNEAGQLGLGDTERRGGPGGTLEMGNSLPAVDIVGVNGSAAGLSVESISLGGSSACAVLTGGLLKCWGEGVGGQLGLGDTLNRGDQPGEMGDALPFVDLGDEVAVSSVAVAFKHACAVIENGFVKCWGLNDGGQLGYEDRLPRGNGIGPMGNELGVVDLGGDQRAIAVAAGWYHTCALLYTGDVKCWGFGDDGRLGQGAGVTLIGHTTGTMGDNLKPVDLGTGRKAVALSLGGTHTCAVLDDETVKCFGGNLFGSLGLGNLNSRGNATGNGDMGDSLPELPFEFEGGPAAGGTAVSNVFAGTYHTCVSGAEGGLACFGHNNDGQLGASSEEDSLGDEEGEVEGLTSIDLGTGETIVVPQAAGVGFNSTGDVPPAGSVPPPTPAPSPALRGPTLAPSTRARDAQNIGDESDDGGLSSSTIAFATTGGILIFLFGVCMAGCCLWQRRKDRHRSRGGANAAVAGGGAAGAGALGTAGGKSRVDSGKRVQFSGNVNPVDDIHPLLKGVKLDADGLLIPTTAGGSAETTPPAAAVAAATSHTRGAAAASLSSSAAKRLNSTDAIGGEVKTESVEAKGSGRGKEDGEENQHPPSSSSPSTTTTGADVQMQLPSPRVIPTTTQVGDTGGYVLREGTLSRSGSGHGESAPPPPPPPPSRRRPPPTATMLRAAGVTGGPAAVDAPAATAKATAAVDVEQKMEEKAAGGEGVRDAADQAPAATAPSDTYTGEEKE